MSKVMKRPLVPLRPRSGTRVMLPDPSRRRGRKLRGILFNIVCFLLGAMFPHAVTLAADSEVVTGSDEPAGQMSGEVVHFHLHGMLTETPIEDPFGLSGMQVTSLHTLQQRLNRALEDVAVSGVILTVDAMGFGLAQLEEVHATLQRFKAANKPVHVHLEHAHLLNYVMFSAATVISMPPQSTLWLTGLYGESPYVKDLLTKIGVEGEVISMGQYKSAGESFTRTRPSEPAKANMDWLLDSLYTSLVDMIAQARDIDAEAVRQLIDGGPYLAAQAEAEGLIDVVAHRDGLMTELKARFGQEMVVNNRYEQEARLDLNATNPFALFTHLLARLSKTAAAATKDTIGLVYVEGVIQSGHAQPTPFPTSDTAYAGDIRKALETAADDDTVKAVLVRIDSPGGSASASEVIWNAVRQVRARKPVLVSMGNVAASGGYYVACGADMIFADATTITASIGVVGGKFVTSRMWQKLGVHWAAYKRGLHADMLSPTKHFSQVQRARLMQYMGEMYDLFKDRVTEGRGAKLRQPIDEVAGGRVYSGAQAFELGLIDHIGGLSDAIEHAAAVTSLEDYEVRVIPRPKDFIASMFMQMSDQERPTDISAAALEGSQPLLAMLSAMEPKRARAIKRLLRRVQLIQREGAALLLWQEPLFE